MNQDIQDFIRSQNSKKRSVIESRLRTYGYTQSQINAAFESTNSREKTAPITPKSKFVFVGERAIAVIALLFLAGIFIALPSYLNITGFAVSQDCSETITVINTTCIEDYVVLELQRTSSYEHYYINDVMYPARSIKDWKRVLQTSSPLEIVPETFGHICGNNLVVANC